MKISVLGAGSFGGTIAKVLSENGHSVDLWSHLEDQAEALRASMEVPFIKGAILPSNVNITSDLNCINESEVVIVVVPSFALRETAKSIEKILKEEKIFVICTKGIEASSMKSGYQIFDEEISKIKANVILSGPTHAEELALQKYTSIVSTSKDKEARNLVQDLFNNSYLRVYTNDDILGVEILGAAKNVLAIAAGVCDSHPRLGDNAKAGILTRGLRELKLLGDEEGCNPETFYGLTGLGDLIVTATSQHSRNRKFGELIGKGLTSEEAQKEIGMVVEGLYSVKAIHEMTQKNKLELPLIEVIYACIYENAPIEEAMASIIGRRTKSEK